jgi:hypothetical protein
MPFIRGRYHINPTMGEALEAARQAEAALLALEQQAQQRRVGGSEPDCDSDTEGEAAAHGESNAGNGPVHRVEIEAAEVVPSHSGRTARGFVARVHRAAAPDDKSAGTARGASAPPETHAFSDHRDLVSFLGDALAQNH